MTPTDKLTERPVHLNSPVDPELTKCRRSVTTASVTTEPDKVTCKNCLKKMAGQARVAIKRGEGWPMTTPPGRWTALREHIAQERTALDTTADEHAEYGRDDQSERCYGAVEALDELLTTMDRMEAGQ